MKVFPQRSLPGLCMYRGRPQIRDRVGGEAGGETSSRAGRDGVASTGSRGRAPPEPGAEDEEDEEEEEEEENKEEELVWWVFVEQFGRGRERM